jgi:hypothetical protein
MVVACVRLKKHCSQLTVEQTPQLSFFRNAVAFLLADVAVPRFTAEVCDH